MEPPRGDLRLATTPAVPASGIVEAKPTPRNLAWQRNVKILVGISCGIIIICGAAHFSGQIPQVASYAMFGLMGLGGVGLTAGALIMRQAKQIDDKIKKGKDAGETPLTAAISKGQMLWVRYYLFFGANPLRMGRDDLSPMNLAMSKNHMQMHDLIRHYGG